MENDSFFDRDKYFDMPALAGLFAQLSAAATEGALLTLTMDFLPRFGPREALLCHLHMDAHGVPQALQPIVHWHDGQGPAQRLSVPRRYLLAEAPLAQQCLDGAATPLLVGDVAQSPRRDAVRQAGGSKGGLP